MAGKRKKAGTGPAAPKPAPPRDRLRFLGVVLKSLLAIGIVAGTLSLVVKLGDLTGEQLTDRDRYTVRVIDIDCPSPPGRDRSTFLTEVRYLANLNETVQVVDPDLKDRLVAAFALHPWVAEVRSVTISPDAGIHVDLRFREPVLVVTVDRGTEPRVVDAAGILLPSGINIASLPVLSPVMPAPTFPAGERWPNPIIQRAAELAALYHPSHIEKTPGNWRMTQPDGKVLIVSW